MNFDPSLFGRRVVRNKKNIGNLVGWRYKDGWRLLVLEDNGSLTDHSYYDITILPPERSDD